MKLKGDIFLAVIFALVLATETSDYKSTPTLAHYVQFEWLTKSPGTVIAFRLKKEAQGFLSLCSQGVCVQAEHQWRLMPTPLSYSGNVGILITDSEKWTFRSFRVENSLFEKNHSLIELRLPAQVLHKIDKAEEQIVVDRLKDGELYKIFSSYVWSTRWRRPVWGWVTSQFGSFRNPGLGQPSYAHTGVDLHAPLKTQVLACSDGIVLDEDVDPIYGRVLTLDHGKGLLSRYMHLTSFRVKLGDFVKEGEVIALSGTSGRSEAPHLHWEMRLYGHPVDPIQTSRLLERLAYLE